MVTDMTLLENMYLSGHALSAWDFPIHVARERAKYETLKETPDIKAANPVIRDRNINAARVERLNEIIETRKDFMSRQAEIQDLKKYYADMTFPAV